MPIPIFAPAENGEGYTVTGFVAKTWVWGASFDPNSGLLRLAHPFRAANDAATIGYWRLRSQNFALVRYEADMDMDHELALLPVIEFD